jgi:hypothetical protein
VPDEAAIKMLKKGSIVQLPDDIRSPVFCLTHYALTMVSKTPESYQVSNVVFNGHAC